MLYINTRNEVIYYTEETPDAMYYDSYNLSTMKGSKNALKGVINQLISQYNLTKTEPLPNTIYSLTLDFLGNGITPLLDEKISKISSFFSNDGFSSVVTESPLKVSINNLTIEDIVTKIKDDKFQLLNTEINSLNSTKWVVKF